MTLSSAGGRGGGALGPLGITPQEGTAARPASSQTVAAPEYYNKEMERALMSLPEDIRVRFTP